MPTYKLADDGVLRDADGKALGDWQPKHQIEVTPEMIEAGARILAESWLLRNDRWEADRPEVRDLVANLLATCLGQCAAS